MASYSIDFQQYPWLDAVVLNDAVGETSPALHRKDALQLSLPCCTGQLRQERWLRLRAATVPSPHWQDRRVSLVHSQHEAQEESSPCSPRTCPFCNTALRKQQMVQSMMAHEVERRCADDILKAAAACSREKVTSVSSLVFVPPAACMPADLWRPASEDLLRKERQKSNSTETDYSSTTYAEQPAHHCMRLPGGTKSQSISVSADGSSSNRRVNYRGHLFCEQPATQRQTALQAPIAQLYLHKCRRAAPYAQVMTPLGRELSSHLQGQHLPSIQEERRALKQQQWLLCNNHFDQRFQQRIDHLERSTIHSYPKVIYQNSLVGSAWASNVQPLAWGLFHCK